MLMYRDEKITNESDCEYYDDDDDVVFVEDDDEDDVDVENDVVASYSNRMKITELMNHRLNLDDELMS